MKVTENGETRYVVKVDRKRPSIYIKEGFIEDIGLLVRLANFTHKDNGRLLYGRRAMEENEMEKIARDGIGDNEAIRIESHGIYLDQKHVGFKPIKGGVSVPSRCLSDMFSPHDIETILTTKLENRTNRVIGSEHIERLKVLKVIKKRDDEWYMNPAIMNNIAIVDEDTMEMFEDDWMSGKILL